ncbi:MAG: hypothetical protein ABH824_04915 [Nanoarchaeota archaeon]|nr:hypothetical protein [Nanoarchaeota archaeon]MBU1631765.1 hypothetical protein [Nanoarchaeota archaeon]MBU1876165.1 hypothetical protein [Nanoarchaeota archaeon]
MISRGTRTCEKCSTVVPLEKVKLYPRDNEKNWLVCETCCEKLKSGVREPGKVNLLKREPIRNAFKPKETISLSSAQKVNTPTNFTKPVVKENLKLKETANPQYKSMFCSRCKYNFKIDLQKAGILHSIYCPYCGKNDQLVKS